MPVVTLVASPSDNASYHITTAASHDVRSMCDAVADEHQAPLRARGPATIQALQPLTYSRTRKRCGSYLRHMVGQLAPLRTHSSRLGGTACRLTRLLIIGMYVSE